MATGPTTLAQRLPQGEYCSVRVSLERAPAIDAGQTLTFKEMVETRHANYTAVGAEVVFTAADGTVTTLRPQRRFYDKSEQPNTEVALSSSWRRDVYLTLAGFAVTLVISLPLGVLVWSPARRGARSAATFARTSARQAARPARS